MKDKAFLYSSTSILLILGVLSFCNLLNQQILANLILAITAIVLAVYTVETYRLRKISNSQLEISLTPNVILFFQGESNERKMYAKNVGKDAAFGVKISDVSIVFKDINEKLDFKFKLKEKNFLIPTEEHEVQVDIYRDNERKGDQAIYFDERYNPTADYDFGIECVNSTGWKLKSTWSLGKSGLLPKKLPSR